MSDAYRPHEALVHPARPTASLARLTLGAALLAVVFLSLILFSWSFLSGLILGLGGADAIEDIASATTPAGVLVNLYLFAFALVALAVTGRVVHGRSLSSFAGDWRLARAQFGRVCLYMVGLYLAIALLMPDQPDMTPQPRTPPALWLAFMPLALPALLIQTGAEEMVFRGYLQSQLAARFGNPRVWMIVPALLFGFLHHDPFTNGEATWIVVLWAMLFGLAAGDLTARTGTLGAAVALHFCNNFLAMFVLAADGYFDGLALYAYPFSVDDPATLWLWAPLDLMMILLGWLTARLALRV